MKKITILLLFTIYVNNYTFAANNTDLLLQQRLENIKLQKEIKNAEDFKKNNSVEKIKKVNDTKKKVEEECFKINKIEIINKSKKLKTRKIEKIVNKKYLNKCFSVDNLESLRSEVNRYYIKKGYSTTIVGFDSDSLKNKIIKLIVKESYINNIEIENEKHSNLKTFFLFPFIKGKVLNLRDIEQGLDQFNRLSSNNGTMDIIDDKVIIKNQKSKNYNFSLNYNNSGNETNGLYQLNTSFNLDNPLLINDNFYINYSDTITNHDNKYSKSIYLSYSIPFGYWTYSFNFSNSKYYNKTKGITNVIIDYSGNTNTYNSSLDKVLYRNSFYKLNSNIELEVIDKVSKIRNTNINNSTYKISNIKLSFNNTFNINNGIIIIKPTFQKGINILDSDKDKTYKNDGIAKNDYELYKLFVYFNKYITSLNSFYTFQFNGQYTNKTLYSSNQFSIGGESTVRAFRDTSLSGDRGFLIKNELSTYLSNIKYINTFFKNNLFLKTKIGIFVDYGLVNDKYDDKYDIYDSKTGQLADVGINLKYNSKYFNYSLTYAKSIFASDFVKKKFENNKMEESIWFSVGIEY